MATRLTYEDLPSHSGTFEPKPFYSRRGDVVYFFFKPDPSWLDRIDGFLTLYRSQDDNQVVGIALKGVRSVLLSTLDAVVEKSTGAERRIAVRFRDLAWYALGKKDPQTEHLEAYLMLLEKEFEGILVPDEALQDAGPS